MSLSKPYKMDDTRYKRVLVLQQQVRTVRVPLYSYRKYSTCTYRSCEDGYRYEYCTSTVCSTSVQVDVQNKYEYSRRLTV